MEPDLFHPSPLWSPCKAKPFLFPFNKHGTDFLINTWQERKIEKGFFVQGKWLYISYLWTCRLVLCPVYKSVMYAKNMQCPSSRRHPYAHFAPFAFSLTFLLHSTTRQQAHTHPHTHTGIMTHSWQGVDMGSFGLLVQHAAALSHCCCSLPLGLNISRGRSSACCADKKKTGECELERETPVLLWQRFSSDD